MRGNEAFRRGQQRVVRTNRFCSDNVRAVCFELSRAERVRVLMPPLALLILGSVVGFIIFSTVLPLLDSMTAFM